MAKSKQRKEQELQQLQEKLEQSTGVVLANYMGLTVPEVQALRQELRDNGAEMVVSKKTLIDLALKNAGLGENVTKQMDGGIAIIFGYEDEVAPAKTVAEFAKEHDVVKLYGGVLEGELIGEEKVIALSKLPSKQELLAKMIGSMRSPVSGFVNVLGGTTRGFVQVLNQIKDQKA